MLQGSLKVPRVGNQAVHSARGELPVDGLEGLSADDKKPPLDVTLDETGP